MFAFSQSSRTSFDCHTMTSLSSYRTCGCFLSGFMGSCMFRLFKISWICFSSTKNVFLTPGFATRPRGLKTRLWFLKTSFPKKTEVQKSLSTSSQRNMFGLSHFIESFCRPLLEFLLECCKSQVFQAIWAFYPWSWNSAYTMCSCLSAIALSAKVPPGLRIPVLLHMECRNSLKVWEVAVHFPSVYFFFPYSENLEILVSHGS